MQPSFMMPKSNLSLPEAVDPVNQSKEREPSGDHGPQDKRSDSEETSSAILPTNRTPDTFHRFRDLPPEIRGKIWHMAWPMRMIWPYESKPAPQFHCKGHTPCVICEMCSWRRPVRTPAVMQACREARLETQRISKPLFTWMFELELLGLLVPGAQASEFRKDLAEREEMMPLVTHFNPETDVIDLCIGSIRRFSKISGPLNHNDVFQAALDHKVPVLLGVDLFDQWDTPEDAYSVILSGLQALYHRYLKTRKHIYIGAGGLVTFVLTDEGWEKAIREDLFSGHYEETRLIPVDDEGLINKYKGLFDHSIQHTKRSNTTESERQAIFYTGKPNAWHNRRLHKHWENWDDSRYSRWISNRLTASRENLSDAQLLMLQIADFLAWEAGLGYGRGEEIMELDGHLKNNHQLVQEHNLRLPDFTPVLVYQAKKIEANNSAVLYHRLSQMRPDLPEEIRRFGD